MKRTIIAILALTVAACTGASDPTTEMSQAAPVQAIYDGFTAGDIPAAIAQMSPGIIWNEAESTAYADGNPYVGPDAIVSGVFMRLGTEWTGFAATPVEFIEDGSRIAVLGRYTATHNTTGKALDAQFVHVWTVEDGKVTSFQQYTDTAKYAAVSTPHAE